MLGACGGATHDGGAGGEQVPMLDGVPIGDCKVPTDGARGEGCPAQPPVDSTPCEAPNGLKRCAYDIQANGGRAVQLVSVCHPDQLTWGSLSASCGTVCSSLSGDVLELAANCGDRELVSCRNADSVFTFETEQQWLDNAFERVLTKCLGLQRYNRQLQFEVANGCGTRVSSNMPFSPDAAACLRTELDSVRFQCGVRLSCSSFAAYNMTTN